jgi:hypothetical protein
MHLGRWGGLHLEATIFNNFLIILCMNVIKKYVNVNMTRDIVLIQQWQ